MLSLLLGSPKSLGALVALLVLGGALAVSRGQLAGVRRELGAEQADHRRCLLERDEVASNRDRLAEAIREQSSAVEALETRARQMEAEASARAARTLQTGQARRRAILSSDGGVGPAEVNQWLHDSFSSSAAWPGVPTGPP